MKKIIGFLLAVGGPLAGTFLGMPLWMWIFISVVGLILMFS